MDFSSELTLAVTIIFLVIMSGFFSGSETALTALSKAKIHKLIQKGHKRASYISKLREDKDRLISTILIGNNLVNILASVLATKLFLILYGDSGIFAVTTIMTIIVVIFAEVLPKTYALYNAENVALSVSLILRILMKLFYPFTVITKSCVDIFLKLFGISKKNTKTNLISAIEELRGTIELHHIEGGVLKQDKDMLDSILDLAETEVSAVMTHRKNMFIIDAKDSNEQILKTISKSPFTRIPIWEDKKDNIIGILHAKDVLKTTINSTKNTESLDFSKIASKPWFIPENTTLREQLFAFKQQRNHFAIVVDEYGTVMGIVTLEDILEEIVGEIKDEHDKGSVEYYKEITTGCYVIEGSAAVRDVNRDLDLSLPEENASTIAGLLIHACERIPHRDEKFEFFGFKFKVLEKHKNQITKLKITKIDDDQDEDSII